MEKIKHLFLLLLIIIAFFIPGMSKEKEYYEIYFYLNNYSTYPGEEIPVSLQGYYYYLSKNSDFTEKVTFKIYKLPPDLTHDKYEDYCKKNKPVREFKKDITMKKSGEYWYGYETFKIPPMEIGSYYIIASTEKAKYGYEVHVGKLGLSAKSSKDNIIIFLQDKKTGNLLSNIDVSLHINKETKKYKTDKNGFVNVNIKELENAKPGDNLKIIAERDNDRVELNISLPGQEAFLKGYIYTDRPVYRPDQKVYFKGTMRLEKRDKLEYAENKDVAVLIQNTQGAEIYKKTLKTDEYGSISGDFMLEKEASPGYYYIYCTYENQQATGSFQVEEYRKPEFEIKASPEKEQYIQGEKIVFNINANYYFGAPLPEKEFTWEIYRNYYYPVYLYESVPYYYNYNNGNSGEFITSNKGRTDKNGKAFITWESGKVDHDSTYILKIRMTDESRREVIGSTSTKVTRGGFYLTITPEKYFYNTGDKAHIKIQAKDYNDKPVSTELTLKMKYERYDKKKNTWNWEDTETVRIKTDENGIAYHDFKTREDGYYEIYGETKDRYNNEITAYNYLYIYSGYGWYNWYRINNLEIIPDKPVYDTGETANFFIVCPFKDVKALVTIEGEELFSQEIMDFANKTGSLHVKLTKKHTPNFYVTVSFFHEGNFYYQTKKVVCPSKDKFLTLSIEPDKEKYKPRDNAKFIIKTLDSNNKPVSSQLSLGVADESVYGVVSDNTPNIQEFFYGMKDNYTYTYGPNGYIYGGPNYNRYGYATCDDECSKSGYMDMDATGGEKLREKRREDTVQPDFTREYFPDTAYFNPGIITDHNGRAEVNFAIPDTLTTWRATARAVSKGTDVGENTKKIIVSKNLLARLIMPRFFTERDETVVTGIIHNYLNKEKTVYAKLEIDGGIEINDENQRKINIKPDGSATVNWKVKINRAGEWKVKLTALTDEESDAVMLTIPILGHGTEKYTGISGSTNSKTEAEIELPKEAGEGSAKCVIMVEPSLASTILTSLDYLIGFPYGCVEQTMSRFLPNVVVAKTLGELDIYDPNINRELPEMVKEGFDRLYNFHHDDGGWGWWENDESHPYMTSYVIYGLSLAKGGGYKVDENRIKRGISWIKSRYEGEKDLDTKAYMAFAVTMAGENCKDWLMGLYGKREELDNYSRAVLALSLKKTGYEKEAKTIADLLETSVYTSGTTVCWKGKTGGHGWTDNQVETTAYCLKALLEINPGSKLIPGIVRFLAMSRNGDYWYSTKDTAAAVMALTGYIKTTKEMNPDFTADIYFNGTKIKNFKFTKEDVGKEGKKIEIPCNGGLLKGKNKVKFEMNGKGMLYYAVYMKYYTGEENVKSAASGFTVKRTYYLLKPGEKDEKKRQVKLGSNNTITVKSQDIILVELEVTGSSDYEYVIIEDPKPTGCEYDNEQRQNATTWNHWYAHSEERDEKIAYFSTYYWRGVKTLSYRLRAETPGTFHVMPGKAYMMYSPEIGGSSDEIILKVTE